MSRILFAAALAAVALLPVTASASPSPSPALDKILAPAPSAGYVEATTSTQGTLEGAFTAQQFATESQQSSPSDVQATLQRDGFVGGYARSWVDKTSHHALIEAVLAFGGGRGAMKWMAASEAADQAQTSYHNPLHDLNIANYYGSHLAGPNFFADDYGFVKGNDFFWIIAASPQDDLSVLAATQALTQYAFAPGETIPSAQWPENANGPKGLAYLLGRITAYVLIGALLVGVVGVIVGLARRSRRQVS